MTRSLLIIVAAFFTVIFNSLPCALLHPIAVYCTQHRSLLFKNKILRFQKSSNTRKIKKYKLIDLSTSVLSCPTSSCFLKKSRELNQAAKMEPSDTDYNTDKMQNQSITISNKYNQDLLLFQDFFNISSFERMTVPDRGQASTHAVYGALRKTGMIESYEVFKNVDFPRISAESWSLSQRKDDVGKPVTVVATVKLGNSLNGHDNIVHGGILALLIDDVLGFGYEALAVPTAFTANLNVNYLLPVEAGSSFLVTATLTAREGRKLYWRAQVMDKGSSGNIQRLLCEATSLYVIPRDVSHL